MPLITIGQPRISNAFEIGGGFGSGPGLIGSPGGGFPGPGTISIGVPPIGGTTGSTGGTSGSGSFYPATAVNWASDAAGALLGLDWGRIAAFLLGLILIAGGIFLIRTVRQQVTVVTKHVGRLAAEAGEAAG